MHKEEFNNGTVNGKPSKSQQRSAPHGSVEPVPTRTSVSSPIPVPILSRANQDAFTDMRRQHYGDTERYGAPVRGNEVRDMLCNPNDTKTPNNPTRNEQLQGTTQRASTQ